MSNINIDFKKGNGLVPVIVQDFNSHEVLMLGYMNEEAYQKTIETSWVHFYSRSRKKLWMKGETTGNKLKVQNMSSDCDEDSLLVQVTCIGKNVCHRGTTSCFDHFQTDMHDRLYLFKRNKRIDVDKLYAFITLRKRSKPRKSYTASLLSSDVDRIIQKVGEEATEVIIAAKNKNRKEIISEVADLWFHSLVLLAMFNITPLAIYTELGKRNKESAKPIDTS